MKLAFGVCLAILVVACSPATLDPRGSVDVWSARPDAPLADLAARTAGLTFSPAPRTQPWAQMLAQNGRPDLVVVEPGSDVAAAREAGLLTDLSVYLPRLKSPTLRLPSLNLPGVYPAYFLPSSVSIWGLYYNPTLLKRHGVTPPVDWPQLLEALRTLKTNGITPIALGSSFAWPALAWWSALDLRLNGAEAHRSLLAGTRSFGDPGFVAVHTTLVDWKAKGWFDNQAFTKNWPEALADVAAGRAGFTLLGSFGLTRITDPSVLAFLPLPSTPKPPGELVSVQGFVLSAHARDPEAALALADAYIVAGSLGQTEEIFRSPVVTAENLSPFQTQQSVWLKRAQVAAPLLDRTLPDAAAKKADQIAVQFFSPGARLTVAELTLAFESLNIGRLP